MNNTHDHGWIAVIGQLRKDHGRLPLPYVEAVRAQGAKAKVLSTFHLLPDEETPYDLEVVSGIEVDDTSQLEGAAGLLLPGGGDIDPAWYGCEQHPKTTRVSHRRDRFELNLISEALERDMPILAICHGMQLLNVYYGGTLEQHIPDDPRRLAHDIGYPRPEPVHKISIAPEGLLAEILGTTATDVNSHHHQGVGRVGRGLEEVAWAEDGVLEAVVASKQTWVVGIQWHPEAMAPVDDSQARLFEAFVAASARYADNESLVEARSA